MAEERYTLEQAAAKVGFRADDLAATLPDAGIDLNSPGHEGGTLSGAEVEQREGMPAALLRIGARAEVRSLAFYFPGFSAVRSRMAKTPPIAGRALKPCSWPETVSYQSVNGARVLDVSANL